MRTRSGAARRIPLRVLAAIAALQGVTVAHAQEDAAPAPAPPERTSIRHRPPAQGQDERALVLSARLEGSGASRLVLAYRARSTPAFLRVEARLEGDVWTMAIPATDVRAPLVEYYIEALDGEGVRLASLGDPWSPLRVSVPVASADPVREPWFWTALGGAAVVLAGAIVLGIVLGSQSTGPAEPGAVVELGD